MHTLPALNLAYFSPLPPAPSGIADYSRHLLPALAQHAAITLISDQPDLPAALTDHFPVLPSAAFPAHRYQFDLLLYQMGNSRHHDALYPFACRYPGVVVLHDTNLHHFATHRTLAQGHFAEFCREVGLAQGHSGWAWQVAGGSRAHSHDMPLHHRLLHTSLGLIVHGRYAAQQISQTQPAAAIATIPALIESYPARSRRAQLGWPDDALIFASVGQMTAPKQVRMALHAFAQLRQQVPNARYLLVGDVLPDSGVDATIAELGLADVVARLGHVPDLPTFADWIATADIVVNLRHPTVGETSATALRAMAAGKPVVVFNQGWYAELPAAACVQVPPLDAAALHDALLALAQNAARRHQIGDAARAYVQTHCQPTAVAAQYAAFLHQIWNQYKVGGDG